MESLLLLGFILTSIITPWGIAVVFFTFLTSCLSRVFLRSALLKNLYMIFSFVLLLYLSVLSIALGGGGSFLLMLFSMGLGVPFSVGWLLGWPIAVLLQTAAQGPNSSTQGQS